MLYDIVFFVFVKIYNDYQQLPTVSNRLQKVLISKISCQVVKMAKIVKSCLKLNQSVFEYNVFLSYFPC